MVKFIFRALVLALTALPLAAHASVPSLSVEPLKYEQQLELGKLQQGYVDVANPSDVTVTVTSNVQAFRQIDDQGNLQFYDDDRLKNAVKVDLSSFDLGPREAVRVAFTIDPSKLGNGGAYGVIFFKTQPKQSENNGVQVQTSAQVGTLLILTVGDGGVKSGKLGTNLLQLAFGKSMASHYSFKNTATGSNAIAFTPNIQVKAGWFGKWSNAQTGLVTPGLTRNFTQSVTGTHFGIFPVAYRDTVTHAAGTTLVIGSIGSGIIILVLIIVAILGIWLAWNNRGRRR